MGRRPRATTKRPSIVARQEVSGAVVKSAGRVLQLLEFFDDIKRPTSVGEVCDALGYPQSSASALLRSLVTLGYLHYEPGARTYIPTSRVALLGSWVNSHFFQDGKILQLMKELNQRTGDTIVLASRNGLQAQYIHVIQATSPARLHMTLGTVRPLAASGCGYAFLSTMPDNEVVRLVNRINAEQPDPNKIVKPRELLDKLKTFRREGYAFATNLVTKGGGIIAAPLPHSRDESVLVVGIGGIAEVMTTRKAELAAILRESIDRYFKPHVAARRVTPLTG